MQNLDRYRTFLIAAKYQNFSKAATELFVSQSSISQTISALEDSLGLKLFNRFGKRISLTEEGKLLYSELVPGFERIERGEELLRQMANLEKGSIRIGASDTLCRHYLIDSFKVFREKYCDIKMTIQNTPSPQVLDLLKEGLIDVGFINGCVSDVREYNYTEIIDVSEVFFTSKNFPELLEKEISKSDLKLYPLITLGNHTSTRRILNQILDTDAHFQPAVEVISLDLLVDLVEIGFGVGFTHKKMVEKKSLPIIKTDFPVPNRKLLMLTNKNQFLSPSAEAFMEIVEMENKKDYRK